MELSQSNCVNDLTTAPASSVAPAPAKTARRFRFRFRFSTQTLLLAILLAGFCTLLWRKWTPWALTHRVRTVQWNLKDVEISPDGRRILIGNDGGEFALHDAATGELLKTFEGHTASPKGFYAFSPDGKSILADDETGKHIEILDSATLERQSISKVGPIDYTNLAFYSPDGALLYLSFSTYNELDRSLPTKWYSGVSAIDASSGVQKFKLGGELDSDFHAQLIRNGRQLAGLMNGRWTVYDAKSGVKQYELKLQDKENGRGNYQGWPVVPPCVSHDGRRVYGITDAGIACWDADSGRPIADFPASGKITENIYRMVLSPDDTKLVMQYWDPLDAKQGAMRLWLVPPTTSTPSAPTKAWECKALAFSEKCGPFGPDSPPVFSSDSNRIFAANQTGISILDANTGAALGEIVTDYVNAFTQTDANTLALGCHHLGDYDGGWLEIWQRRRPEYAWGVLVLPELWITLVLTLALLRSLRNDRRQFKRAESAR